MILLPSLIVLVLLRRVRAPFVPRVYIGKRTTNVKASSTVSTWDTRKHLPWSGYKPLHWRSLESESMFQVVSRPMCPRHSLLLQSSQHPELQSIPPFTSPYSIQNSLPPPP